MDGWVIKTCSGDLKIPPGRPSVTHRFVFLIDVIRYLGTLNLKLQTDKQTDTNPKSVTYLDGWIELMATGKSMGLL